MNLKITVSAHHMLSAQLWSAISDKLQKKGLKINFVTYSRECYLFLKKKSKKCIYTADEIDKYKIKGNLKNRLIEIEKKYNIPSLELLLTGDLEHSMMKREKAYTILVKHFYFWEDYFRKNKIAFMVGGVERFVNMVPQAVCRKHKTQFISFSAAPLPERFIATKEMMGHYSCLDEYWEKNRNRRLTKKERKNAGQFIRTFRQNTDKIPLVAGLFPKPKLNIKKIKFFLDRLRVSLFVEKRGYPYMDILGGTYRYLLKMVRASAAKKYYSKFDPTEKYVFYPLHVPTDGQLLVVAPQYINQQYVTEIISRSLPAGYKLYVKEHPGDVGGTPLEDLEKIAGLPNVKLLPPFENSLKIIENSDCVITINSTVGWEALLLKKPVINLGRVFYEISGLTCPLRDFYKLPGTIRLALRANPITEETLLKFVNALFAVTHQGDLVASTLYYSDRTRAEIILQDENIEKIAEGMYNQLKQWSYK
jgi:capsule polysaccharide modification protein KpsS